MAEKELLNDGQLTNVTGGVNQQSYGLYINGIYRLKNNINIFKVVRDITTSNDGSKVVKYNDAIDLGNYFVDADSIIKNMEIERFKSSYAYDGSYSVN